MNLDGFSCKNSLHTKKYIVKGYAASENKISYCLIRNKNEKFLFNIELNPVRIYNLISIDSFEEIHNYGFDKFYKPLGYLTANFYIVRTIPNKITSNMFIITNDENLTFEYVDKDRFFEVSKEEFNKHINDDIWVPNEVIVHNGKMHADDILCVSLLKYFNPNIKCTRTRDIPENFKGIVCDVGGGRYDHHELNKFRTDGNGDIRYLPTGEPELYAAFGLLAKDILPGVVGEKNFFLIDNQIIRSLDNSDNYGTFSDLAYMFSLFNPAWNESKTPDEAFEEAVEYGLKFITELISKEKARVEAIPYIDSKIAKTKDRILVLDYRVPWQTAAKKSNILFGIFPTDEGTFALQTVPTLKSDARNKANKVDMPEYWLDTPPMGCNFVHKGLFFAIFDTQENAINAAKEAIENGKYNE